MAVLTLQPSMSGAAFKVKVGTPNKTAAFLRVFYLLLFIFGMCVFGGVFFFLEAEPGPHKVSHQILFR